MNRGERRRLLLRIGAAVAVVGVLAAVVAVIRFLHPAESRRATEYDGRTWVQPKATGPLLLVNGITGLVEGQMGDSNVTRAEVMGSSARASLVAWDGSVHLISNETLRAEDLGVGASAVTALSDSSVWAVVSGGGSTAVRTRSPERGSAWLDVDVGSLPGSLRSVSTPLVDDSDVAHFLLASDDQTYHVRVASLATKATVDVVGRDSRLVPVDDEVRVVTVPAGASEPVAVAGDAPTRFDSLALGVDADSFALWHGVVWTLLGDTLRSEPGNESFSLGERARLYPDGGRLWGVGSQRAVSIGRRAGDVLVIELPDAIELCLGDCSKSSLQNEVATTSTTPSPTTSVADSTPEQTTTVPVTPPPVSVPPVSETTTTTTVVLAEPPTTLGPTSDTELETTSTAPLDLSGFTTVPVDTEPPDTDPPDTDPPDTEPPVTEPAPSGIPEFQVSYNPETTELSYSYVPNGCAESATVNWRVTTAVGATSSSGDVSGASTLAVRPDESTADILKVIVWASAVCVDTQVEMTPYTWENPDVTLLLNQGSVAVNGLEASVSFRGEFFNGWRLAGGADTSINWTVVCEGSSGTVVAVVTPAPFDEASGTMAASIRADDDANCSVTLAVSISREDGGTDSPMVSLVFSVASTVPPSTPDTDPPSSDPPSSDPSSSNPSDSNSPGSNPSGSVPSPPTSGPPPTT